ncbi:DnaJ C-terminal domain-containing protein [Lignipirellula cremea]|uniref:Curved DNA-binding protein n=1 Tax=Lignipirellula cremea TaxID=2528010 RepID=A0A518E324_9BACT|nr:J domain-containing protein [Lignipirellula cremea]QDU98489.1 Curved DNA-binding protein [Lignipirellula cremea]
MADDYYKTLGISRDASQADIEKAHRKLAHKYHPDINPDDKTAAEKFNQVQEAYDVLSDSNKREMFDRYGSAFDSMGAGGPGGSPRGGPRGGGGQGFEDVDWSQMFGGGQPGGGAAGFEDIFRHFSQAGAEPRRSRRKPQKGSDLGHEITVPFHTAVQGGDARLSIQRPSGKVESIDVKVPAGIEDGKKIRLRGQGEASSTGGAAGDILLTIRVAPHPFFERKGRNLEVVVPVTLGEALSGAKIDLPTPKGTLTLKIPAGVSSGKRLRVKGHGVASPDGPGDLFAEIRIDLPGAVELDETEQAVIDKIEAQYKASPRADLRW